MISSRASLSPFLLAALLVIAAHFLAVSSFEAAGNLAGPVLGLVVVAMLCGANERVMWHAIWGSVACAVVYLASESLPANTYAMALCAVLILTTWFFLLAWIYHEWQKIHQAIPNSYPKLKYAPILVSLGVASLYAVDAACDILFGVTLFGLLRNLGGDGFGIMNGVEESLHIYSYLRFVLGVVAIATLTFFAVPTGVTELDEEIKRWHEERDGRVKRIGVASDPESSDALPNDLKGQLSANIGDLAGAFASFAITLKHLPKIIHALMADVWITIRVNVLTFALLLVSFLTGYPTIVVFGYFATVFASISLSYFLSTDFPSLLRAILDVLGLLMSLAGLSILADLAHIRERRGLSVSARATRIQARPQAVFALRFFVMVGLIVPLAVALALCALGIMRKIGFTPEAVGHWYGNSHMLALGGFEIFLALVVYFLMSRNKTVPSPFGLWGDRALAYVVEKKNRILTGAGRRGP